MARTRAAKKGDAPEPDHYPGEGVSTGADTYEGPKTPESERETDDEE